MFRTQLRRIRTASSLLFSGSIAVAVCLAFAQLSVASPLAVPTGNVIIAVTGENPVTHQGRTANFTAAINTSDGTFELIDATSPGTGWSLTDLDVSGNSDPFTSVNYAITNSAAVTLTFTVSVTTPISAQGPLTLHGGSMGATLTDANNNGSATVGTSPGVPLYQGQIDGATVLGIYPDPYSLSTVFAGQSIQVPALNPGLPGPTLPSGAAVNTIGIVNQFTLSPGDIYSGNSFFVVVSVPEPSTLALLAITVVTLAGRRRR
jgi:hypothetical protein